MFYEMKEREESNGDVVEEEHSLLVLKSNQPNFYFAQQHLDQKIQVSVFY